MMKRYISAIIRSFYDPRVYREAVEQWKGYGGVYMLIISAVVGFGLFAQLLFALNTFEAKQLDSVAQQIPNIVYDNGILLVKEEQPVHIKSSKLNVIIDTTKSENELRATKAQIGIGKNFIFIQMNDRYQVHQFERTEDKPPIHLNPQTIKSLWAQSVPTVKMIALPVFWIGQFIQSVVTCLAIAFVSYLVTSFMKEEYLFLTRMRLAALAMTPPMIITMLLHVFIQHTTAPWFLIVLAALYMYVMIILMRRYGPSIVQVADAREL